MRLKLMRIGLIVIIIALLLVSLAVCIESTNDLQTNNTLTKNPQTKNPQKCQGSKPDECNGKCVNFQNDEKNCGSCGNACNQGEVCKNGKCVSGTNNKKATCTDGKKNGKETDVDCGGPTCPPCADEKTCKNSTDCTSGVCTNGICQAPSCTDGVKNGNETGVDCGGPCKPCTRKPISDIGNITTLPGQIFTPPPQTPTYKFVLDKCYVVYTRASLTDTDYASLGVAVGTYGRYGYGNVAPNPKATYMGEISSAGNPTYSINLVVGPISIPNDPNVPVTIAYLIVNSDSGAYKAPNIRDSILNAGTEALIDSYVPGSGSALAFADNNLQDILQSYCDGTVAADKIITNGQEIAQWTANGPHTGTQAYSGTDSSIGCGSNSWYQVWWHVEKVS